MQTSERTTSKALAALALASLLTAPAWSQDADPTPGADAANPYASGESFGSAYGSRGGVGESYGATLRSGPADPYISIYRYGTTKSDGLGERYAPSNLYEPKDPSAPADSNLSMYRHGTTNPDGLAYRYGSGDLSADSNDPGATSDDDPMNAGLSPSRKSRDGSDMSEGDDESALSYPYPTLPSAAPSGLADALGATPSAAADGAGVNDANSAWASAVKNPLSAGRAPVNAAKPKRGGKPANAWGEPNVPKSAVDGALGFNPYDPKSVLGDNLVSSAGKATAAGGPIMGTAPPSSGGLASPLPALPSSVGPSSVGPSSVGPSVPGGPSL